MKAGCVPGQAGALQLKRVPASEENYMQAAISQGIRQLAWQGRGKWHVSRAAAALQSTGHALQGHDAWQVSQPHQPGR